MKNKKLSFWILTVFFGLFFLALVLSQQGGETQGENMTMGSMMKSHVSGLSPQELLQSWQVAPSVSGGESHHVVNGIMETIAVISTMLLYGSVPLLLGGAVLLVVLWL